MANPYRKWKVYDVVQNDHDVWIDPYQPLIAAHYLNIATVVRGVNGPTTINAPLDEFIKWVTECRAGWYKG